MTEKHKWPLSREFPLVIKALISLSPRYIKSPYTTVEQVQIKRDLTLHVLHNIAMNEGVLLPEQAQADNMPEDPPHGPRLIKAPS